MHHPAIYDLISIIEDYFILTESEFRCQIEPIIYNKPSDPRLPTENIRECKGLKITRQLMYGKIEVNIFGIGKDSDSMDIQYFIFEDSQQPTEIIELVCHQSGEKYNTDLARIAIRKIVILDKIQSQSVNSN